MSPAAATRADARKVVCALRQAGHLAYFAGGAVRDLLLGREPKDYDVATAASPAEVEALFPETRPVGRQFGVVLVLVEGRPLEVATFRAEGEYTDGRRPAEVHYTTDPREDVQRRDFTINGLLLDPETEEVHDWVGGRADLAARRIRAIGDPRRRFQEDHLRPLRAVRFAAELDFEREPRIAAAIRELAGEVATVSGERIRDELLRLLVSAGASRGLDLLHELGLLAVILPEVTALVGVEQPGEFHPEGDVYTHTRLTLAALRSPSAVLALGGLLHDLGKPATFARRDRIRFHGHDRKGAELAEQVCRRLRLSKADSEQVVTLVRDHMRIADAPKMRRATLRRLLARPRFADLLELHRADCLACHGKLDAHEFCRDALTEIANEPILPPPLLSGRDLLALGFEPGPLIGEILKQLEDARLEGQLTTRDEALGWVLERWAELLPNP